MIFDPKNGGGGSIDPPPLPQKPKKWPPPNPLLRKPKKVGFKWGGLGGVQTKNSLGDAFIGQNSDFGKGLNKRFNPLG